MPVEIGQLIVNARVVTDEQPVAPRGDHSDAAEGTADHELVERCVNEVLRILEDKRER
jgi:hypothetical protein